MSEVGDDWESAYKCLAASMKVKPQTPTSTLNLLKYESIVREAKKNKETSITSVTLSQLS